MVVRGDDATRFIAGDATYSEADPAATAGAMMAVAPGFVAEAAILGDVAPDVLRQGLGGPGLPPLP